MPDCTSGPHPAGARKKKEREREWEREKGREGGRERDKERGREGERSAALIGVKLLEAAQASQGVVFVPIFRLRPLSHTHTQAHTRTHT